MLLYQPHGECMLAWTATSSTYPQTHPPARPPTPMYPTPCCRQYADLDGYIHYLDCGERFFAPGGRAIDPALMPDALHPSTTGFELFAECLLPLVATVMQGHMPGGQNIAMANASVPVAQA